MYSSLCGVCVVCSLVNVDLFHFQYYYKMKDSMALYHKIPSSLSLVFLFIFDYANICGEIAAFERFPLVHQQQGGGSAMFTSIRQFVHMEFSTSST
jgi:hypothetical protein